MARDESPQDKKARSLARDRRNTYGENDKSSRTAIRGRKRWASRSYRHRFRQVLEREMVVSEGEEVVDPRKRVQWRKSADTPLGDLLYGRRYARLERSIMARMREDPEFLDRLQVAAIHAGLVETEARMIMRQMRASFVTFQRDATRISERALELLLRLVRRIR